MASCHVVVDDVDDNSLDGDHSASSGSMHRRSSF
jgi:hypothetical protein